MDQRLFNLRQMRIGLILALLATFGGFVLGGIFGGLEHEAHNILARRAQSVLQTVYYNDQAAMAAGEKAAWTFWKRAHLHASAMGTSAMLLLLTLAFVPAPGRGRWLASLGLGGGAIGYACFLLLAGWRCPVIGDGYTTKHTVAWLAIPSAGSYILGALGAILLIARPLFAPIGTLVPPRASKPSAKPAAHGELKPLPLRSQPQPAPALAVANHRARSRN